MRLTSFVAVSAVSAISVAAAADTKGPAYQIFEDGSLGFPLPPKKVLGADKGLDATVSDCILRAPAASGSAVYWLEIGKAGNVTTAKVRGTGSSALDSCIAGGLKKAAITEKLPGSFVLFGRIDVLDRNRNLGTFNPSPKMSDVAVLVDAKGGAWQLGTKRLAYTENRAADIAQALDAQATALNACAAKRAKTAPDVDVAAWVDGSKALVRSTGESTYDACLARALDAIKLPTGASALWLELSLKKAAEPLAPRTDKASLGKDQALRDALTTAVRSRKDALLDCVDGKTSKLAKLTVALAGGKANVKAVATGVPAADACVKTKFVDVVIKAAAPEDKLDYEVTLEPQ